MYNKIIESTKYIISKVNRMPKIAIILGSGLGDLCIWVSEIIKEI